MTQQHQTNFDKYIPAFLFICAVLLYANTLTFGFVLDDVAVITKNKFVQHGISGIPDILTTFYWQGYWEQNTGLYRPLSLISFAVEWEISPDNPFIHHLSNIILYALSITVLYRLLLKLLHKYTPLLSAATCLVFAMHPLHTEVVSNIKSKDEILCFLFFALMANDVLRHKKMTWIGTMYFFLALLSKESAVMFLPAIFLMLLMFTEANAKTISKQLIPAVIVTGIWTTARFFILKNAPAHIPYTYADNSLLACDNILSQKLTAITILGKYLLQFILPLQFSYDYSFNQIPCATFSDANLWMALAIIMLLIIVAIKTFSTKPAISFGILFFFLTILPVSNLLFNIGTTKADRLMFTPILGLLIALMYFVFHLTSQLTKATLSSKPAVIATTIAVLCFALSFERSTAWASNYNLFTTDINNAPNSGRVNYNYGTLLLNSGPDTADFSKALQYLETANTIDSNDYNTVCNLGVAYYKNQRYDDAIRSLRKAAAMNSKNGSTYLNLADVYFTTQIWDSAAKYYTTAIDLNARNAQTHNKAGTAFFNRSQYVNAVKMFEAGLKLYPDNSEMLINYGNALAMLKNYTSALSAFEKAYTQDRKQTKALYFMGLTYQHIGKQKEADSMITLFNKANMNK